MPGNLRKLLNEEKFLLYALVRMYKPKRMIELGVSEGKSSLAIALAMEDNGFGLLTSVDNWSRRHGGKAGGPQKAQALLDSCGVGKHISLVASDSQEFLKAQKEDSQDIVYVDAGHDYDEAMQDTLEAIRVAKEFVIVHDSKNLKGVRDACLDIEKGFFIDAGRGYWLYRIPDVRWIG